MSEPSRQPIPHGHESRASGAPPEGLAARREHSLNSLLELSRELKVSLDLHQTVDLLLFNLMGQFGTARAALWLFESAPAPRAVMIRCHGLQRAAAGSAIEAAEAALRRRMELELSPILCWALKDDLEAPVFHLVRQAGIALFAPLFAHRDLLGLLALGDRLDGEAYTPGDLKTLETALGMVGMSLLNARLYNRMLENNRQLRLTNERLREHDRLKTEFLSNVNHELRTPLAVVIGTMECLVEHGVADPAMRELLVSGLQKSHDLRGLIENLLVLSDATRGRLEFHIEPGDAGSLLESFHADRLAGVSEALRDFRYRPARDLPAARFDRQRLLQILDELVDNAVKFTPSGSSLELRARRHEQDEASWLAIELADNGPGIPPDRMDSIFRSFEQVDGSWTRKVGGLGVGLAFARGLAEGMNGKLLARSTPGSGSVFTILLPAA
jgi:signal transduction histidine kinase